MAIQHQSKRGGRRRRGERGSQSLEWIGLGSFIVTLLVAATEFARAHGGDVGQALTQHLTRILQPQ